MGSQGIKSLDQDLRRRGLLPRKAGGGVKGGDFADRVVGAFLIEEKETVRAEIPIRTWWKKVVAEASRRGRLPAIVLSLSSIIHHDTQFRLAVIPYHAFLALLEEAGESERHLRRGPARYSRSLQQHPRSDR